MYVDRMTILFGFIHSSVIWRLRTATLSHVGTNSTRCQEVVCQQARSLKFRKPERLDSRERKYFHSLVP